MNLSGNNPRKSIDHVSEMLDYLIHSVSGVDELAGYMLAAAINDSRFEDECLREYGTLDYSKTGMDPYRILENAGAIDLDGNWRPSNY